MYSAAGAFAVRMPRGEEENNDKEAENLTGKNLPQHVVEDFKAMVENEWKEAVSELTSTGDVSKEDTYKYLCSLLMVSRRQPNF